MKFSLKRVATLAVVLLAVLPGLAQAQDVSIAPGAKERFLNLKPLAKISCKESHRDRINQTRRIEIGKFNGGDQMVEYLYDGGYLITRCTASGGLLVSQTAEVMSDHRGNVAFVPASTEWIEGGHPTIKVMDYISPDRYDKEFRDSLDQKLVKFSGTVTRVLIPTTSSLSSTSSRKVKVYRVHRRLRKPKAKRRFLTGSFSPIIRARSAQAGVDQCQDLSAYAFIYSDGHRWPAHGFTWRLNSQTINYSAAYTTEITRSFSHWQYTYNDCPAGNAPHQASTSRVLLPRGSDTTSYGLVQDGINAVFAVPNITATCGGYVQACVRLWPDGNVDGTAWEADLAFAGDYTVVDPRTSPPSKIVYADIEGCPRGAPDFGYPAYTCVDFEGQTTHEVGHMLDLAHVSTSFQTMYTAQYAGQPSCPDPLPYYWCLHFKRTLGGGDINGLWVLYGPW